MSDRDAQLEREARDRITRGFEATLAAAREPFGAWWTELRARECCNPRRFPGPSGVTLRHVRGCKAGKAGERYRTEGASGGTSTSNGQGGPGAGAIPPA